MGIGFKILFMPLAYLGMAVLFAVSVASSVFVGQMTGSNETLISFPFLILDRAIAFTSGDLWSGVFIFFNLLQFLVVGWMLKAVREKFYFVGVACFGLAILLTSFSFTTALIWRATDADMRNRQNQITQEAFKDITVEVTSLYDKTQKVVPRRQVVIKAEIDLLMSKRIKSRGKLYTLKSYTSTCQKIYSRAQRDCEHYFKLKRELAESIDYTANKRQVKTAIHQQKSNLVPDPDVGFSYVAKMIGVKGSEKNKGATAAETIEKWRILGPQVLVEIFTLVGFTLIRWGMRGASMPPYGDPKTPCKTLKNHTELNGSSSMTESIDESVDKDAGTPSPPLRVIEGGKATGCVLEDGRGQQESSQAGNGAGHFAVCDNSSLIAFAAHVGDTELIRVPEFMQKYKAFCQLNGLQALGQNVIGTLLEPIGGEKGHKFIPFWSETAGRMKQSKRILWRLAYDQIELVEAKRQRAVA